MSKQQEIFTNNSKAMLYSMSRREAAQIQLLVHAAKIMNATLFIDIGANIGAYTSVMARKSVTERVISFEASPTTFVELAENIRLQDLSSVTAHNVALSDQKQELEFLERRPLAGANAIASTANSSHHANSIKSTVECVPLDDVVTVQGESIIIKLDVEGHECQVLKGAQSLLTDNDCLLQVEFLDHGAVEKGESILAAFGYRRALYLHNDFYYLPEENSDLRTDIRDFSFSTFSDVLNDYLAMVTYASKITRQVRDFKEQYPDFEDQFPRVNFPRGQSLFN